MTDLIDRLEGIAHANMLVGAYSEAAAIKQAVEEVERLRALEKRMKEAPRLIVEDCSGELCLTNMDALEMEIGVPYVLLEYRHDDPNES